MAERFNPCAIIPVYNHGATVGTVATTLLAQGLPCFLVDDGCDASSAAALDALALQPGVTLLRHAHNRGKGAAMITGFRACEQLGYTHALQLDADGQHDLADVPAFIAAAAQYPDALVGGAPLYGNDAPSARRYGRWLTAAWVWINTLSCDIPDAMCGFRLYPLLTTLPIANRPSMGKRMDFDIDIIVRMHWRGIPMRWIPTAVRYPPNGISHFDMVRDNARISRTHARLFLGMLLRAPRILAQRARLWIKHGSI